MKTKKEKIRFSIVIVLLIACLGCLYYYFFIRVNTDWMFWKSNGEDINWSSIEYDDNFFPTDTVEVYGDYGEWKFREFKPIYAGYGTTEDNLNYLIGKYLDEEGEEQTVKILVSGEGMPEWPFPDGGFTSFYNSYYIENVAIRGEEWDPERKVYTSTVEYSSESNFIPIKPDDGSCPEEVLLSYDEVSNYINVEDSFLKYSFVEEDLLATYCNPYYMYYNSNGYSKILHPFSDVVKELKSGDQFSVRYLESQKTFEGCQYDYNDVQKVFCANEYLNEIYDDFLVGIYIEVYY